MFNNIREEQKIRKTLRNISRQRVALVMQPDNIWVIENALIINDDNDAHLKTCYMRGWVEQIDHAVPTGKLTPSGHLPQGEMFTGASPMYRLTDSGWSVINRSHQFTLLTAFLALLTLIATIG